MKCSKAGYCLCAVLALKCSATMVLAQTTYYVMPVNPNAAPPYTNWATAATNIQDAVDVAAAGDRIMVADGIYNAGGVAGYPGGSPLTNRVAVYKPVAIASVNGPDFTVIEGSGPMGDAAVRCVYLTNGASLSGFTLKNGHTRTNGYFKALRGGGAYCESSDCVISNCVITDCSAATLGGGVYSGTRIDCLITSNRAVEAGGGAIFGILSNCFVRSNRASLGGGVNNATLYRCVIEGNTAITNGGGAYYSRLSHCTLAGNTAVVNCGGGAFASSLTNCVIVGNSAGNEGGGTFFCQLYNCSVVRNTAAVAGGGDSGSTLFNSIVYYNHAASSSNGSGSTFNYCCTTPMPGFGAGNITNEPFIVCGSNVRLLLGSPCLEAGTNQLWMAGTVDMDGEPRLRGIVDMGADELWPDGLTGSLSVAISAGDTQAPLEISLPFEAQIQGRCVGYVWDFGDGHAETNRWLVQHAYASTGDYHVVLSASNLSATVAATLTVHVVAYDQFVTTNGNDEYAGTNWATAKATIQAAVEAAALVGGRVWVSNGVYNTGGVAGYPTGSTLTNRVAIYKPITVRSVNGPAVTVIRGLSAAEGGPVRCVYLTNGAVLVGFTLSRGHGLDSGDTEKDMSGGGVWCESATRDAAVISNCVIEDCSAVMYGGGVLRGRLFNCELRGNSAQLGGGASGSSLFACRLEYNEADEGGGARHGFLQNCTLYANQAFLGGGTAYSDADRCTYEQNWVLNGSGGGAYGGTLRYCVLRDNWAIETTAEARGGGASHCVLTNCLLTGNFATYGGGASDCTLESCTVSSNGAGLAGGGVHRGSAVNSIVYFNGAATNREWYGATFKYSCTYPLPAGVGNTSNDPCFMNLAALDFRLRTNSPCVDLGTNLPWMAGATDFEGKPRILGTTVDMGAYEVIPAWLDSDGDRMPDYWEWAYSHSLTGLVADADNDGDRFSNLHEYLAGTDPKDAASLLRISGVEREAASNIVIRWQSVAGRFYRLERGTNLLAAQPFSLNVRSNIPATPPLNTETDAAVGIEPHFYRIGLEQ